MANRPRLPAWKKLRHWLPPAFVLFVLLSCALTLFIDVACLDWRMAFFENIDSHGLVRALMEMYAKRHYINLRDPFTYYGMLFLYLSHIPLSLIHAFRADLQPFDFFLAERYVCLFFSLGSCLLFFPFGRAYRLPKWFPYFAIALTLTVPEFFYYSFFPKPETTQFFFILLAHKVA